MTIAICQLKSLSKRVIFLLVPLYVFAALPWLLYPDTTEPDSAYMVTEISVFNVLICCKGHEKDKRFVNQGGI